MKRHSLGWVAISLTLAACNGIANGSNVRQPEDCVAGAPAPKSEAGMDQTILCIKTATAQRTFTVEIARTSAEQAKGLMFRRELADDRGMIFPFPESRMASFWMKNTVIPLDIIFIRADGIIENIAANTTPYSLDPVESTAPVAAVLEIRGGLAAAMGIRPGDIVRWTDK
ncbi:MAG: DUF192 domain-containing protein [Sphingorhabdus sp.]